MGTFKIVEVFPPCVQEYSLEHDLISNIISHYGWFVDRDDMRQVLMRYLNFAFIISPFIQTDREIRCSIRFNTVRENVHKVIDLIIVREINYED
jgi:hypothetical protein